MTVVVLHKHRQGKTFTQTTLSDNETGHVESFSDIIFKMQISSYAIFHQLKLLIKKKKIGVTKLSPRPRYKERRE